MGIFYGQTGNIIGGIDNVLYFEPHGDEGGYYSFIRADLYFGKQERILGSAIKHKGEVFLGKRHSDCIKAIVSERDVKKVNGDSPQGFFTTHGRFVDRVEGAKVALRARQISGLKFSKTELFSEDLW